MHNHQIKHLILETTKQNASLIYFILEANDNLCFYSTLDFETGEALRRISIKYPIELSKEMEQTLASLAKFAPFQKIDPA